MLFNRTELSQGSQTNRIRGQARTRERAGDD
jgi:hypothetical protein